MISQITHVAYRLLHVASRMKNVRDVVQGHPLRIVTRLIKSKGIHWLLGRFR